jgi:hypothetical protein
MCQTITINGKEYRNYGELKKVIGFTPPIRNFAFELPDDACLCHVSASDIAALGNYKYESGGDGFDAVLTTANV